MPPKRLIFKGRIHGFIFSEIYSIVGKLKLVVNEHALVAILWEHEKPNRVKLDSMVKNENHKIIQATKENLTEYFGSPRISFNIPLELNGSNFQKGVWDVLKRNSLWNNHELCRSGKKN